jgi:hypothetical protein
MPSKTWTYTSAVDLKASKMPSIGWSFLASAEPSTAVQNSNEGPVTHDPADKYKQTIVCRISDTNVCGIFAQAESGGGGGGVAAQVPPLLPPTPNPPHSLAPAFSRSSPLPHLRSLLSLSLYLAPSLSFSFSLSLSHTHSHTHTY